MIFPTIQFAAFFVVVLTISWALMPRPRLWKPFILGASYVFYGYADWRFTALLAASTVANQLAARAIRASDEQKRRKLLLTLIVVFNIGLLGVFKYFDFFIESVNRVLTSLGLEAPMPILAIALPVGISFFTFQAISYVVDVYHRVIEPATMLDFAIYEAFFPHLVAGPIVRAREFLPQLATPRNHRSIPAGPAVFLIAGGLFKKIVLADLLATRIVDPVFGSPEAHSALEVWVAIYGYAVQIYCDFSAYTDMAIGLALLLGFRFPQNFDRPYAARSLQDFWRRWHMTLSRWLRDYLYIPLGGSRGSSAKTYRNLMLTMLIGGLWHGASWTFVIWGGIHGTGLALERWWRLRHPPVPPGQLPPVAQHLGGAGRPRGGRLHEAWALRLPQAQGRDPCHVGPHGLRPEALALGGGHVQRRVPGVGVLPFTGPEYGVRHARTAHGLGPCAARHVGRRRGDRRRDVDPVPAVMGLARDVNSGSRRDLSWCRACSTACSSW